MVVNAAYEKHAHAHVIIKNKKYYVTFGELIRVFSFTMTYATFFLQHGIIVQLFRKGVTARNKLYSCQIHILTQWSDKELDVLHKVARGSSFDTIYCSQWMYVFRTLCN